ncbi:MAG: ribonuclease III [Gammaproteobacteria bacterium]|nr:MAG: ribonuclease III [Gammaproteobacteria bacterium]
MTDLEGFAARLGHPFADRGLLDQALTHRSAGARHNERLEYLGDALLGLVIADELYCLLPHADEGELSRMRASLVRRETLAEIARDLELGENLRLGPGELKSGGYRRDSVLANGLEAVIGAAYLDGGFAAGQALLRQLYAERLANLPADGSAKDPKTRLQEYLQARGRPLPEYRVAEGIGEDHDHTFTVECRVDGLAGSLSGVGRSRRKAEQAAASEALVRLVDA